MICPNCKSDQSVSENQFGALFTCPSCQAVYFINFTGQPEYSDQIEEPPTDLNLNSEPISTIPIPEVSPPQTDLASLDETLQSALDDAMSLPQIPSDGWGSNDPLQFNETPPIQEPVVTKNNDILNDLRPPEEALNQMINSDQAPLQRSPPTHERPQRKTTSPDTGFLSIAQEITDFGNTETQIAQLNYDLHVRGLDTGEIRKLFIEAIHDSRFGWDAADIVKSIRHGEVIIRQLNPAKAYVLAKRLQFIDIEQKWTQNAIN